MLVSNTFLGIIKVHDIRIPHKNLSISIYFIYNGILLHNNLGASAKITTFMCIVGLFISLRACVAYVYVVFVIVVVIR